MSRPFVTLLIPALLTSGLFFIVQQLDAGLFFFFLPTLPILSVGLSTSPKNALAVALMAQPPITFITSALMQGDFSLSLLFLLFFALPVCYMCYMFLHRRDLMLTPQMHTLRIWYPTGTVMLHLALYACACWALLTAFYATQEMNLPHLLAQDMQADLAQIEKEYDLALDPSLQGMAFLFCGLLTWVWGVGLWAHAWLANRALDRKKLAQRRSLAITPFLMPDWLLSLLGICALAALIGGESLQFLGRTSLIILLLPYFFLGLGVLHFHTRGWPHQMLFLCSIYALVLFAIWPAFLLSGIGLWHHVKTFNKHLPPDETSSKS